MRHLLAASLVLVLATAAFAQDPNNPPISAKAREIQQSAIVIDTHADTPGRFVDENFDMATDTHDGHMDLGKARAANLGAEFFSIWVRPGIPGGYAHRALDMIDSVHRQAALHPDSMVMTYSADDIVRARSGHHKRLAALIGVEGGHSIENDIRILRDYYRLGARYMTLTWANTNEWADSSGDVDDTKIQHHNGLTDFGKQVVAEMNRLGMMVDISHVSDKTFWDVIGITRAPVIASHSGARSLNGHVRNMTDDMLKAVAKNGGVVQVNFCSCFVDEDYRKRYDAMAPERDTAMNALREKLKDADPKTAAAEYERVSKEWGDKVGRPPLKSLIDQIDHIAKVAGVDHVGLGSDFDGVDSLPAGIDSVADLPKITQELLDRGYKPNDIKKILGGNLLRVFREVERVSARIQREQGANKAAD